MKTEIQCHLFQWWGGCLVAALALSRRDAIACAKACMPGARYVGRCHGRNVVAGMSLTTDRARQVLQQEAI